MFLFDSEADDSIKAWFPTYGVSVRRRPWYGSIVLQGASESLLKIPKFETKRLLRCWILHDNQRKPEHRAPYCLSLEGNGSPFSCARSLLTLIAR